MAPIPSTSGLHTDATPSIHHQHNRERNYYNRDGIAIAVRRLREVGRSLEILNDATSETFGLAVEAFRADLEGAGEAVDWMDPVQQGNLSDRDGDEVQEDEVMERLERLVSRNLSSAVRCADYLPGKFLGRSRLGFRCTSTRGWCCRDKRYSYRIPTSTAQLYIIVR